MSKKQALISLILNSLIVLGTTGVVISYFFIKLDYLDSPFQRFCFFTTDSNILSAIAAVVVVIFDIKILRGKNNALPHIVELFKFVAVTAVILTFCTVMVLLVPVYGAKRELLGTAAYMHVGGPMLALLSFTLVEKSTRLSVPETFLGLVPVVIYGAVYFVEVILIGVQNGGWPDFYSFNKNGNWMLTVVIILAATIAIGFLVRLLHNINIKKQNRVRS